MNQYKYVAMNMDREKYTGSFIAEDENDLAVQLQKQGLYLVSCKIYNASVKASFFSLSVGSVKLAELTTFCRQFAIMINSGISIVGCIDILKGQNYSSYFKKVLQVVSDDVRAGKMLSEALDRHKKVFPDFFRSMAAVGESSGRMDVVLNSLAEYYENDTKLKKQVKAAFSYPIMLAIMTIGIVAIMLGFVVPTFRESLSSLDIQATGITKIVYDLSDFIVNYGLYVLAIVVVLALLIFVFSRTKSGRYLFDKLKLTLPIVKKINIDLISARFCRSLALLLTSGMDLSDSLDSVLIVFGNQYFEKKFRQAIEEVRHGLNLASTFAKYKLFPPLLTQMVAVGEKANALDDVLNRSCSFFDDQATSTIQSITSKIQPTMLLLMGGIIGFLFLAIYSPMLDIMQNIA